MINGLSVVARNLNAGDDEFDAIKTPEPDGPDSLWRLLERAPKGWVLIVDNADDTAFLAKPPESGEVQLPLLAEGNGWVRQTRRGLVIVTSRQREDAYWPKGAVVIEVEELSELDSAKILKGEAPNGGSLAEAKVLARQLGGLPLALRLAGRYLGSRFAVYKTFAAYGRALGADSTKIKRLDGRAGDKRSALMFTWELSLDALAAQNIPQARPLLRLLSCYSPALPIPSAMIQSGVVESFLARAAPSAPDEPVLDVDAVLEALRELGLIDSAERGGAKPDNGEPPDTDVVVHPVVAHTNRAHLAARGKRDSYERLVRHTAIEAIAAVIDELDAASDASWPTFRILTPHLQALLSDSAPRLDAGDLSRLIQLAGGTAAAYGYMKSPGFGIELARLALSHDSDGDDTTDPAVLKVREHLGYLLRCESKDADAEEIFRGVLRTRLRQLPPDDPECLLARHNVIASSWRNADWAESRKIFDGLLDDQRRVLGNPHGITLHTRLEFAQLQHALGYRAEAETLLRAIVDDASWSYGDNHAFVLAAKENLSQVRESDAGIRVVPAGQGRLYSIIQPGTPSREQQTAAALLHKGIMLMGVSREDALAAFENVINRFGGDTTRQTRLAVGEAMFKRAEILREMGRPEEALRAYAEMAGRHATDSAPDIRLSVARALFWQATILGELEGPDEEAAALDELTEQFAADMMFPVRQLVAGAFERKGVLRRDEPEQAMRELDQAVEWYQDLAGDYPGDYDSDLKAAAYSRDLMKIRLVNELFQQASAMQEQGSEEEALAAFQKLDTRFGHEAAPPIREALANALLRVAVLTDKLSRES